MRHAALFCALLGLAPLVCNAATPVASGVDLIAGKFVPDQQPDGNSIIFHTADGLLVIDTGRHAEHTQQIIDYAQQSKQPIVAVINSHWHLDHISGNPRVRAAFPQARFYASDALSDALKGFLADYHKQLEDVLSKPADEKQKQAWRSELATIDAGSKLAPDDVISSTRQLRIGGHAFDVHLEKHSVTAGDVWVFDPTSRVLAAGDLVTLPAPFFDTACPAHWKTALDDVAHADFKQLVPGHGAPMSRKQFETYRKAYGNLLACSAGKAAKSACIDGWIHDSESLLAEGERDLARHLLDYYMDASLRADAKHTAKLCSDAS